MSSEQDYDIEPFEDRYNQLEKSKKQGLESFWGDIVSFLSDTERDWVRKQDIKNSQGINNRRFSHGYDAFIEVFEPPVGTGEAFAFYEMDYDEIVYVGEELEIPGPSIEILRTDTDRYLEGDQEDI